MNIDRRPSQTPVTEILKIIVMFTVNLYQIGRVSRKTIAASYRREGFLGRGMDIGKIHRKAESTGP